MKVLPILLLLMGCGMTSQGDAFRTGVSVEGAKAMDAGLENAMWFVCFGASHGSVERRFGVTQDVADAYNKLCDHTGVSTTLQVD